MLELIWRKAISEDRVSLWTPLRLLLWPLAWLYRLGSIIQRLMIGPPVRLEVPVLSVGNIAVGGTGKTPLVEFIVRDLLKEGYRVGVVSSGYGRAAKESFIKPGYKIQRMAPHLIGDEVKYLSSCLPEAIFGVGQSKTETARRLVEKNDVDLIVVDDGYQHYGLYRDIDIITYDAAVDRHLLKPFPRGVLREPLTAIKRANTVILTRAKFAEDIGQLSDELQRLHPRGNFYRARFSSDELVGRERSLPVKYLEDKSVFLFAGIGNFAALKRQVVALCADLDHALELSDHQRYGDAVLNRIKARADAFDSDVILTTGKDWVKLEGFEFGREIYYLNQTIDLDPGEEKLILQIKEQLNLREIAD